MKIAVIAADLLPDKLGGAEAHLVEVIKRLSPKHQFLLFVGTNKKIKNSFNQQVRVYTVNYPRISNLYGLSYIVFAYFQIKKILKDQDFDLLWAKQCYPQAPLAALLKRKFNKPLYITAQNPLLHQEELVIKGSLLRPFQKLISSALTPLISWSLQKADLLACVSNYSQQSAKKMGAKQTALIANGINFQQFSLSHRPSNGLKIITTSSLIPRNGIDTLIKAVALLPQKLDFTLRIAGEGPEKAKLVLLTKRLNIQSKVKFLGRIANQQIPQLLSQADIFVRVSRKEGFGVSFLEAMAAGVPVIATPVGGITDFLRDRENGLLVQPDNPQQLLQAITLLATDQKLAKKLVIQAQKMVANNYSWEKIANEIEKQFTKLV